MYEIQQFMSGSLSDCQMSHCFLFVISQVENNRAHAPERSNTEGVFHGVHLKCCWLDALSTAKGLFVSWVWRTWQPTRALAPSGLHSDWFGLVQPGWRVEGIETESNFLSQGVDSRALSDGGQENVYCTLILPLLLSSSTIPPLTNCGFLSEPLLWPKRE